MYESSLIKKVPDMPFRSESEVIALERALGVVRKTFSLRGYRLIETPLMERAELFLRKSGGAMTHRLYSFDEPGGIAVSLRPEITASVIRHVAETTSDEMKERRFQYSGPVFRYSSPGEEHSDLPRQFIQAGAELLGVENPSGDGEIIAMAREGMVALGFSNAIVSIGHVKPMSKLLNDLGLPKRARLFIEDNIELLGRNGSGLLEVKEKAEAYGLLGKSDTGEDTLEYRENEASSLIDSIVAPTDANSGIRSRQEIVERLAHKHLDAVTPKLFERALRFVSELVAMKGIPEEVLRLARQTTSAYGLNPNHFEYLEATLSATREGGVPPKNIRVDFGISRGVSYYSGMIFEIFRDRDASDKSVVGAGGRYNRLASAVGAQMGIPALGFVYHLESLVNSPKTDDSIIPTKQTILLTWENETGREKANKRAAELRTNGIPTVLVFGGADSAKALARDYLGSLTEKF